MTYPSTAEYGQVEKNGWPMSVKTLLDSAERNGRTYHFYHATPGYECAGSAMRYQENEIYGVMFELDGARHGRRFLTYHEAVEHFETCKTRR